MRILVAWASDQSPNLGVRALAAGSSDLLRCVWPDAEIAFTDFGTNPQRIPWGKTRSLWKERATGAAGMMEWLASFDLFWDTRSGDSFADIYGLRRHRVMSLMHEFAVDAGALAVLAPQTIGPFRTAPGRMLARRTLRRSALVFARDPKSAQAAVGLRRPADATVTDLVFGIAQPRIGEARDVLLNVSGLLWEPNRHADHLMYRAAVRDIVARLQAGGRSVTLLPHVIDAPGVDNDVPVSLLLARELSDVDTVLPTSLDDVRAAVAGARVVIGARMHACLNALSVGTPAVAMAYSRKFDPLLRDLGWPATVDIAAADASNVASDVVGWARDDSLVSRASEVRAAGRKRLEVARSLLERL